MTTRSAVADFLGQEALAIVGASKSGKKFGNIALTALKERGYRVFPIHPRAHDVDGERCYRTVAELPEKVDGIFVSVPPSETEKVVREADAAGIRRVWMQQGAESAASLDFCREHGMTVIHGECIMMFLEHAGFPHVMHGFFKHLIRPLPR